MTADDSSFCHQEIKQTTINYVLTEKDGAKTSSLNLKVTEAAVFVQQMNPENQKQNLLYFCHFIIFRTIHHIKATLLCEKSDEAKKWKENFKRRCYRKNNRENK